jgi:hypothetical protein
MLPGRPIAEVRAAAIQLLNNKRFVRATVSDESIKPQDKRSALASALENQKKEKTQ